MNDPGNTPDGPSPNDRVLMVDERPSLDLPAGAMINPDGSVSLALNHPFILKNPVGGSNVVHVERVNGLLLRRLSGADVRKIIGSSDMPRMATAFSLAVSLKKLGAIETFIDARDYDAAKSVVAELLGGMEPGLPSYAEETPAGIRLPLLRPVPDGPSGPRSEILFRFLTGAQILLISRAPSMIDWGVALAAGISPKAARSLFDASDGADAMAMNAVVFALCGVGPAILRRASR